MKLYGFLLLVLCSGKLYSQKMSTAYSLETALEKIDSSANRLKMMANDARSLKDSIVFPVETQALVPTNLVQEQTKPSINVSASAPNPENYYTIEVYYSQFPLTKDHKLYKTFPNLKETLMLGLFRYTVGKFTSDKKAKEFIEYIHEKGYMGTLVRFDNGRRVLN